MSTTRRNTVKVPDEECLCTHGIVCEGCRQLNGSYQGRTVPIMNPEDEDVPLGWGASAGAENGFTSWHDRNMYMAAPWEEGPETAEDPEENAEEWSVSVNRWHFVSLDAYKLTTPRRRQVIIEVELNSGESRRYIIFKDQVHSVYTKGSSSCLPSGCERIGPLRIEEVIIAMCVVENAYSPKQLKFKFAGAANALRFHTSLIDTLGGPRHV